MRPAGAVGHPNRDSYSDSHGYAYNHTDGHCNCYRHVKRDADRHVNGDPDGYRDRNIKRDWYRCRHSYRDGQHDTDRDSHRYGRDSGRKRDCERGSPQHGALYERGTTACLRLF